MLTAGKGLLGIEQKEDRIARLFVPEHHQNT